MTSKETTFYEELQNCKGLDLRDKRGKVHDLAYVLVLFTIALFRGRDGKMSRLHRSMKNKHKELSISLSIDYNQVKVISRSYLPLFLEKIDGYVFADLLRKFYGVALTKEEQQWFGGDGKELRGSIKKGDKRGHAIVGLVEHQTMRTACYSYYSGKKESEKTCLEELIEKEQMWSSNFTFDALHLSPNMTSKIETAGGNYIIGLKGNQGLLSTQMLLHSELEEAMQTFDTTEVKNGRIEERYYEAYDIKEVLKDKRWDKSGFRTLFTVRRIRTENSTGKISEELSFYISNSEISKAKLCFEAIRNHWSCEVVNHYRDVTFKEDDLKTKCATITKVTSAIRTLIINALMLDKPKNMTALLDDFNDDFQLLIKYLKTIKFL